MKKIAICMLAVIAAVCTACSSGNNGESPGSDMDYTVVAREEIPEEINLIVEEKKTEPFTFTYELNGYLYVVEGFGTQPTGGYCIKVSEVTEKTKDILIDNILVGPAAGEAVNKVSTYPFIVIKIECTDKNIVFK